MNNLSAKKNIRLEFNLKIGLQSPGWLIPNFMKISAEHHNKMKVDDNSAEHFRTNRTVKTKSEKAGNFAEVLII